MQKIKYYIRKKKYLFLFFSVLLLFGFIIGLLLGISNIDILRESVTYYAENIQNRSYNYLFIHFFILVIGLGTSFVGLGIPILCTLLFYEGLSFGFIISIFSVTCGIGGFLFSLLFLIITKVIYLFLFLLFFLKCIEIARKMIGKFIYKTEFPHIVISLLKASILFICFIFINDLVVLFLGNKILPIFGFLIV